ncbi:hypothetical protein [Mesorhizobium sp. M0118]|uniref:hypothetical protein n=1 Tax=Mesorhizobium sp. M0118 TaxID=2956884 RepID=UPI003338FFD5
MSLIQLEDGDLINTDNVIKFTKLRGDIYKFLDVNGGEHVGTANWPEEKFWPVLPAAAGYMAIFSDDEGSLRCRTVVGWRVCPGGNFAIVEGGETGEYTYSAILQPDGSVIDIDGNVFGGIDAFIEAEAAGFADAA